MYVHFKIIKMTLGFEELSNLLTLKTVGFIIKRALVNISESMNSYKNRCSNTVFIFGLRYSTVQYFT